jgi:hypothetical protein
VYPNINRLNTKDIAATIVEEGFIIGKNNSVNVSLDCDAVEIYTNMKTRSPLNNFKKGPFYVGTISFRKNGEFTDSWKFDNNYIGTPIIKLAEKLQERYGVEIVINDEYEVVWGKSDTGI